MCFVDKYRSPVRAWGQTVGQTMQQVTGSDTDSVSGSSKSHDSSPSSSPHDMLRRQIVSSQSFDELNEDDLDKTQGWFETFKGEMSLFLYSVNY